MTEVLTQHPTREVADTIPGNPLDQGRRMQQRREWEEAFFTAQRTQHVSKVAERNGTASLENSAHPIDVAPISVAVSAALAGSTTAPGLNGAPPMAINTGANGSPVLTDGKSSAAMLNTTADPIAAVRVASPANVASREPTSAPAVPRPAIPLTLQRADPIAVQIYEHNGDVQVLVRDLSLAEPQARGLIARMRSLLNRIGLSLLTFTLNGNRLVGGPPKQVSESALRNERSDPLDLSI